ncbi:ABC transporter permease [bacterium]|nr:MAG: ABC transporter permease [bacterium]
MIRFGSIALVALREITERVTGRATWILTGLTTFLAVGLIVVPSLTNQSGGSTNLGLVGPQAQALAPAINAAAKAAAIDLTTRNVDSEATARSELTPPINARAGGGSRLALLTGQNRAALDAALLYDGTSATIEAYQTVPPGISALLRSVLNVIHQRSLLSAAGLSASQITAAEKPVPTVTVALQPEPSDLPGREITALAAAFLLMYAVAGFGSAVATGVAQEKTSRTAEVLLAAVQPRELMTGKVIGIGLVGLGQMTITVGGAMIANALVKSQAIPSELPTLLPMIIVWFVLGFGLYAFGFAAAGAMVARQEEVQSVTMPFTAFLVAGLFLVYATIASPDAPWVRLLSFFPPLSPILMPARLALGHISVWELPLAIAIELVSIVGMARLAGGIYRAALVRGGARLSWRAALNLR